MDTRCQISAVWLAALILTANACMRSLPETIGDPPPESQPPLLIRGLEGRDVWPLVFDRAGFSGEISEQVTQWMRIEQQITGFPLVAGNRVELLIDGPMTFNAMFAAMRQARHHIHLETFIINDDAIGSELADILIERARAGVAVRMIIDAFGALGAEEEYLGRLRRAGIQIHKYHPINPFEDLRIWRINTRHHRKLLIVDGRIGFVGGINISEVYASSSFREPDRVRGPDEAWRDTHLRVQGPIVNTLQKLFVVFWADLHGTAPLTGHAYFPDVPRKGPTLARAVNSMAADERYRIYKLYLTALRFARKTIWITQGYFSPDRTFLEGLKNAARRGVDVRLLLPGVTDSWITISSSRAHYAELLEAGVRVFERRDVLQHAKTAVVDGIWSTVGSTNLDYRSFLHSNEVNLVIWGREFALRMEVLFLYDQARNVEIKLQEWKQRPVYRRLLETFASMLDYWL